jgi:hypothetical protein
LAAAEPTPVIKEERREIEPPPVDEDPAREIPIEEWVLGEDPGAVYYLSRIREAHQEGNPRFARELLRQMKDIHPDSGLIEVAEILFEKGGKVR